MNERLDYLRDKLLGRIAAEITEKRCVVLPSGVTLSLRQGDITDECVDAIVNAANEGLVHGGGVAGAIVRKGGATIQEESDRIGRVATGSVAVTGAGRLPAKWIIHAVGPVWRGHTPEENDRLLKLATQNALTVAAQQGLSSIAFPAISSGIFGFPKDRCGRVMLCAIRDWADANGNSSLQDIRVTIIDTETLSDFTSEWH